MDIDERDRRIEGLLTEQVDCAERLRALLLSEQEALSDHHAAALADIAAQKGRLVHRLDHLEHRRREMSSAAPLPPGGTAHPPPRSGSLTQLWEPLMVLLTQCRQLNEANRQALNSVQVAVTHTLSTLNDPLSGRALYGPHGRRLDSSGSNTLVKA